MTRADIEILLKYLIKATVPPPDQDAFFAAIHRLEALLHKGKIAA